MNLPAVKGKETFRLGQNNWGCFFSTEYSYNEMLSRGHSLNHLSNVSGSAFIGIDFPQTVRFCADADTYQVVVFA